MTPENEARDILHAALEAGVNFIDTADSYFDGESERIVGRFLKETGLRDSVFLATKAFYPTGKGPNDHGLSRYYLFRACEASLSRLQTDHIDFYLAHRMMAEIPIDETLGAMTDLVRQGKVRYIGCSTYPAWAVVEALLTSKMHGYARFVMESPPYNILDRRIENELVPACQKYGLGVSPWSPLAMGMLAGRYVPGGPFPEGSRAAVSPQGIYAQRISRRGLEVAARLPEVAALYGLTPGQLALLWVKDQPGITSPIVGPRTANQLREMLKVADMRADERLHQLIDTLNPPGRATANFHNTSGWMKNGVC
jgi:aryl-alcohol dehydrogenase-like predicted oxidoreductase